MAVADLLARRIDERVPAAYLTREAWLGDFRFYVDERVIIPRSHIAELLPDGLAPFVGRPRERRDSARPVHRLRLPRHPARHAYPQADIDAIDISPDALAVAQRNVSEYGLADRINLIRSDLFANLPEKSYDLIISNPPYVVATAMESLPSEFRHEPEIALAGGEDGMDLVRGILREAPRFLAPHGLLVVEVGHNRMQAEAAFPRLPFAWLEVPGAEDGVFLVSPRRHRRTPLVGRVLLEPRRGQCRMT